MQTGGVGKMFCPEVECDTNLPDHVIRCVLSEGDIIKLVQQVYLCSCPFPTAYVIKRVLFTIDMRSCWKNTDGMPFQGWCFVPGRSVIQGWCLIHKKSWQCAQLVNIHFVKHAASCGMVTLLSVQLLYRYVYACVLH